MKKKLLIIDDEKSIVESLTRALMGQDFELSSSLEADKALEMIKEIVPQVVISDLKMPKLDGLQLLARIKEFNPGIQVIMITGHGTIDDAVTAMKRGAYDFIPKPFNKQEIIAIVNRAFEKAELLAENFILKEKLKQNLAPAFDMGKSRAYKALLERAGHAAASDATILLLGESGTGKEVLAQYIFMRSNRDASPFITVNCAAIPENLLEAELFGYKKGAFTGAYHDKKGRFQDANGGTLFLDEIGEMPLAVQPKLLRILQEGEINPVGGSTQKVDVRIIAATNKNLRKQVEAGLFREDLFYRLNVIPLQIPPLRLRPEDLHSLISHFLAIYGKKNKKPNLPLSAEALALMESYSWPGNVRELENAIERSVILCLGDKIMPDDLPDELRTVTESATHIFVGQGMTLDEIEMSVIQSGLKRNHGDKVKTAEELGVSLRTIYRKLDMAGPVREEDGSPRAESELG